jgi:NAD/NADP transhydrogenase alpha subunit
MRKAELKIAKLREVIEKLHKGEEVDVEKVLGTGDETQELEWEEALQEIENEDRMWQTNKQRRREAKAKQEAEEQEASPINDSSDKAYGVEHSTGAPAQAPPGFY